MHAASDAPCVLEIFLSCVQCHSHAGALSSFCQPLESDATVGAASRPLPYRGAPSRDARHACPCLLTHASGGARVRPLSLRKKVLEMGAAGAFSLVPG